MTDRDRRERLAEYVAVLHGFGLSDEEVLAVHDEDTLPDGFSLPEFFDHRFDDADESTLYDRLHDALAASGPGIDADREYWAHAPARQLDEACRYHGWRVDVAGDGPISFSVTAPDGETRESTFEYPESNLGEHNYPALAAAVAAHLDGLTFALLTDRDGRWRFVLVESTLLAELRDRHGERVRVFRRPLLRAEQPEDFARDADDAAGTTDRVSELASVAGDAFAESVGTGPRVHRSSRPLETEVEVRSEPETVVGEGIDEVFETLEGGGDGSTDPPRATASENVDDDVASLLSDLDEPERSGDGPTGGATATRSSSDDVGDDESGRTGSPDLVGGGPKTTVVENGLEDVFADLEGTNPPAREEDPERMETDDVLDSVADEAEPTGTADADESVEPDTDDGTVAADETVTADAMVDEVESTDGASAESDVPEPAADTAERPPAPILDEDELTLPEDDSQAADASSGPGSERANEADIEPTVDSGHAADADSDHATEADVEPATAADTDADGDLPDADATVVEDDATDLPETGTSDDDPGTETVVFSGVEPEEGTDTADDPPATVAVDGTADEETADEGTEPADERAESADEATKSADEGMADGAMEPADEGTEPADDPFDVDEPASVVDDDTATEVATLADFESDPMEADAGDVAEAVDAETAGSAAAEAESTGTDSTESPAKSDEPESTPGIDEIDLDVDEDDIPDIDEDEPTSTAGPLAGGVGPNAGTAAPESPADAADEQATDDRATDDGVSEERDDEVAQPDISTGDAIDADLLADPNESALADAEADDEYPDVVVGRLGGDDGSESKRGRLGRLAAWIRNLF